MRQLYLWLFVVLLLSVTYAQALGQLLEERP